MIIKRLALYTLTFLILGFLSLAGFYVFLSGDLPNVDNWSFQPKRITRVFSADGMHLKDFLEEDRELVTYEEIPRAMRDALIAIEDQRFHTHWGIDVRRIIGSVVANLRSRRLVGQGASTLTQQLARNTFTEVGQQRSSASMEAVVATYARKIREQITAVQIERLYTKQEILTLYLNTVFFGHNSYGLKSAARFYFDKDVDELTIDECALLAGLLPAPNHFSPYRNPEAARRKRNQVLASMVQTGAISSSTASRLQELPVNTSRRQRAETYGLAPYFIEHIRQQLHLMYGSGLYRDGITVTTTLDSRLQRIAQKHYDTEIARVQQRVQAYLDRRTDKSNVPDSIVVQAAFVAMDPATGHILALIGGRDFAQSEFNRATQARRQPGSAFKAFVYTAAIDNNRFTVDLMEDNAITLWERDRLWDPDNYDRRFLGWMTLREAFKQSRNVVSIKLADEIGAGMVRRYARAMGIGTPISAVPSIGIGTSDVRLIDMVSAYAVYPNQGIGVEPIGITHITDQDGSVLLDQPSGSKREVLRPAAAVVMTDMLRSVVDETGGTGRSLRTVYGFRTPAAGKTGTTNDYRDAWFIGFTPHLVAGVWIGMDDASLHLWPRQSGAVAALPLWARFMQEVYRSVEPYASQRHDDFAYSEDLVVRLPVCTETHKLASRFCPEHTMDIFIKGEALPPECSLHGGQRGTTSRTQRF